MIESFKDVIERAVTRPDLIQSRIVRAGVS
jgi:hypothetical protein